MNPVQSFETPQLYGHSMHAGGWPKLGWELTEQEFFLESQDESASPDEAVNPLFS